MLQLAEVVRLPDAGGDGDLVEDRACLRPLALGGRARVVRRVEHLAGLFLGGGERLAVRVQALEELVEALDDGREVHGVRRVAGPARARERVQLDGGGRLAVVRDQVELAEALDERRRPPLAGLDGARAAVEAGADGAAAGERGDRIVAVRALARTGGERAHEPGRESPEAEPMAKRHGGDDVARGGRAVGDDAASGRIAVVRRRWRRRADPRATRGSWGRCARGWAAVGASCRQPWARPTCTSGRAGASSDQGAARRTPGAAWGGSGSWRRRTCRARRRERRGQGRADRGLRACRGVEHGGKVLDEAARAWGGRPGGRRRRAGEKKSACTGLANDSEYMQRAQSGVYSLREG